ncbi:hypothetical protein E4U26_005216 [Claviceps purpurea]|nr:hypothetical protein E4U26_005216 [Claviceps purpurea]
MFKLRDQPDETIVRAQVYYPSQLNSEQLAVWQIFRTHCRQLAQALAQGPERGLKPAPILMQVDGAGGTGKSFLIHAVSHALESERRAAPTGSTANAGALPRIPPYGLHLVRGRSLV